MSAKMINNRRPLFLLASLAALSLLPACYEPQMGCLDVEAVNYDFSADEAAPADCVYPEIRLRLQHVYSYPDTIVPLRLLDTFYLDEAGNPFRLSRFDFLLSDIRLQLAGSSELGIEEQLAIYLEGPNGRVIEERIPDNFGFGSAGLGASNIDVGTSRESEQVESASFFVGVEGLANEAIADSFPIAHPLGLSDSLIYFSRDSGYVFQLVELFRDTAATDTIPELLRIGTAENLKLIELPLPVFKEPGFHFRIDLQVDYREWLRGLNVASDSREQLAEKIVSNTANAFSVIGVTLEEN